jgi:hypothetical protein
MTIRLFIGRHDYPPGGLFFKSIPGFRVAKTPRNHCDQGAHLEVCKGRLREVLGGAQSRISLHWLTRRRLTGRALRGAIAA